MTDWGPLRSCSTSARPRGLRAPLVGIQQAAAPQGQVLQLNKVLHVTARIQVRA